MNNDLPNNIRKVIKCLRCNNIYELNSFPETKYGNREIGGFKCTCGNIFEPYKAKPIYVDDNNICVVRLKENQEWIPENESIGKYLDLY